MTSKGRNMITDSQLNMSWTTAPAKARRNSFRSAACARETMVLVTEVPMLAPITIGIAGSTCKTCKDTKYIQLSLLPRYLELKGFLEICCLFSTDTILNSPSGCTWALKYKAHIRHSNKKKFCISQPLFSRSILLSHVKWQTIPSVWRKYKFQ